MSVALRGGHRLAKRYLRCLEAQGACPPEDCGGVWGFGDLLHAALR